jgi:class 3 adenylate cyclase
LPNGPPPVVRIARDGAPGSATTIRAVMDEAPRGGGAAAYRGFLFSDMRGFTAFGERHGNQAAAAMVAAFLEIARAAIAHHEGAEIKTEGDAMFAVFPAASSAVLCGLEIVDAAAELSARQPDRPLKLGVGVHAGEAIETAEGYIGRAVNIAARVCAQARPGEVLVTSTVKGITQASIAVGFIPRGQRRLKGIHDPIVVYAVTRDTTVHARHPLPRPVVAGGIVLAAAAVIALAAFAGSRLLPGVGASPSPDAAAGSPKPVAIGALPIGTYTTTGFQPEMTFVIRDQGWAATRDLPATLELVRETSPRGSIHFLRIGAIVEDPCLQGAGGGGSQTGPSSIGLLTALDSLPHVALTGRTAIDVAGIPAEQVDVQVSEASLAACGGLADAGVALFAAGDETWSAAPGERFRLVTFSVGKDPITYIVSADWTQTPAVEEMENLQKLGQTILDHVRF